MGRNALLGTKRMSKRRKLWGAITLLWPPRSSPGKGERGIHPFPGHFCSMKGKQNGVFLLLSMYSRCLGSMKETGGARQLSLDFSLGTVATPSRQKHLLAVFPSSPLLAPTCTRKILVSNQISGEQGPAVWSQWEWT